MMQRFTLIHDGSMQGWQAAYLAFHVAARLGAPLLVILFDSITDEDLILQSAAQVGVGGRAAGLAIETRLVEGFSVEVLKQIAGAVDGFFIPHRLIPDKETAQLFLDALSCPVWIVSKETEMLDWGVLVNDLVSDSALIDYTTNLSNRMQQSLTGLVPSSKLVTTSRTKAAIPWVPLDNSTPAGIAAAIDRLGVSLVFIPISNLSLVIDLNINFVVCPES